MKTLVQNAGVDKGSVEINVSESDSSSSSDSDHKKKFVDNEKIFKKLKNDPTARTNLASIHAARSHKYGYIQFGPKNWYKESLNVSQKFASQVDRRKFRQGLKCNVDFLNQLNMHDLMKELLNGEQELNELPKAVQIKLTDIFECLEKVPMIGILKLINKAKAEKICESLEKIVALAHVSQSMGDYFARDDALDPALSTVCQALRSDIDIEYVLKKSGGTFQSLAASFHHLKSPSDKDVVGSTNTQRSLRSRTSNFSLIRRPLRGYCWYFQKHGRCSKQGCNFLHKCARCGKKTHGDNNCRSRQDRGGE